MSITFVNPSFLWGLPVITIPILIHLLTRKKPRKHYFSAVRFIRLASRDIVSRHKLTQLLLLVLRTLILLSLTFVFARPVIRDMPLFSRDGEASLATVIIIDQSYSMGCVTRGEELFSLAKKVAIRIVEMMKEKDSVALLFVSNEVNSKIPYLTSDKESLLKEIRESSLTYGPTNMSPALLKAYEILHQSGSPNKQIVLITDLARNGWRGVDEKSIPWFDPSIRLILIVPSKEQPSNIGMKGVEQSIVPAGDSTRVSCKLENYGRGDILRLPVTVYLERESEFEAKKGFTTKANCIFVDLKRKQEVERNFLFNFLNWEPCIGMVQIEEDALPLDNRYYFQLQKARRLKVLIIDGDPGSTSFSSEAFYLNACLFSGQYRSELVRSPFSVKTITVEEILREQLDDFSVIILCNVGSFPPGLKEKLAAFARKGGGIIFSLGDKVHPELYNHFFANFVPVRLGEVRHKTEGERIVSQEFNHPVLEVFSRGKEGDLGSARFFRYFSCQIAPSAETILRLGDDEPLLVEGSLADPQAGKVLVFTSSLDTDWNNLPTKPVFLPLIHRTIQYAASSLPSEKGSPSLHVGEQIIYRLNRREQIKSAEITDPEGKVYPLSPKILGEVLSLDFGPVKFPGVYQLTYISGAQKKTVYIPVNLDLESGESDLTRMEHAEIRKLLSSSSIKVIQGMENLEKDMAEILHGREISQDIVFLILGFLLMEVWLVSKGSKETQYEKI